MSEIDQAVEQLIAAIQKSDIYTEYIKQLDLVKEKPGLKEQIDEFRKRNYELQTSPDNAFEKLDQFEREYAGFRENTLVNDFLRAELAFCRKMQEISSKVAQEIYFE